ncbi:MAG TPA: hypothetical protein ENJ56_03870 [Anaerolineae bacterium]|nr:hypothetical protein [Anaerolineae bacterium]
MALFEDFASREYQSLQFAIHGGEQGGQEINLALIGEDGAWSEPSIRIKAEADRWMTYSISLAQFGNPPYIKGIIMQSANSAEQATFYLDDLTFIRKQDIVTSGEGPELAVAFDQVVRPIDPHIYGLNFADDQFAREIDLPINRWGGNAVTRYNWKVDVSNRASDWYFLNVPNDVDEADLPDSNVSNKFIAFNQANNIDTLMTMPLIGWTPKSRAPDCGFEIAKYGEQQYADPAERCGNGMVNEDKAVRRNDPTDTSIAIDQSFVTEWVTYLTERFGSAAENGVRFYSLDNEPMLWHLTHRDVHPDPVGYDELIERSIPYAAAIREADPTAKIMGPTVWGWSAYFFSAIDSEAARWSNPPDRSKHDDIPLVEWYLQQMAAYEAENGVRLLDYLDLHFYPQSAEVALREAGGAGRQARRLESTRNLWDRDYVDKTWIDQPIYLIPRMRDWVDANYPGTKLALTEYNWGGLEHLNGALAQADILGIFGREGLDMAMLWDPPERLQPGAFAFRMYRNYDGFGGKFGDQLLAANSADADQLAIFAASRREDGAVTIMVINKSLLDLQATLSLDGMQGFSAEAQTYRYGSADLLAIQQLDPTPVTEGSINTTFPAQSITLFVLTK